MSFLWMCKIECFCLAKVVFFAHLSAFTSSQKVNLDLKKSMRRLSLKSEKKTHRNLREPTPKAQGLNMLTYFGEMWRWGGLGPIRKTGWDTFLKSHQSTLLFQEPWGARVDKVFVQYLPSWFLKLFKMLPKADRFGWWNQSITSCIFSGRRHGNTCQDIGHVPSSHSQFTREYLHVPCSWNQWTRYFSKTHFIYCMPLATSYNK